MINAMAIDQGDCYEVNTELRGTGGEIEAEARAILKAIWSQKDGPQMVDSILDGFVVWCDEQIKEDK